VSSASSDPRRFADLPRGLVPLGYRDFALYWAGLVTSNTGRWIELTGVVWLASNLADSLFLLGLVGAFRGAPVIILGPIAGAVADRVDQQKLLIATQATALLASLGLWVLVVAGVVELWHLYVQVGLQATVEAFDASIRQAMFPRLIPRAQRVEAVTLTVMAGRTAKFAGPAISGAAIAAFGVAAPFLITAICFLALMGAVALMYGLPPRLPEAGATLRSQLTAGLRYIVEQPVVGGLLRMEAVFAIFEMNPVMITIIGRQVLNVGPQALGLLLSAPGFGALMGLVALLVSGHAVRQGRFVVVSTFAYATVLVVFALSRDFVTSLSLLVFVGLFDVFITVTRMSVIQLVTPGRMRGRVLGATRMVTGGVAQFAQTQSGLLSSILGGPAAVLVAAGLLTLSAGIGARANPDLWRYSRKREPPAGTLPPDVGA